MEYLTDTIAAVSTAIGGGIAIVRLSGDKSLAIAREVFSPVGKCAFESHRIYYGHIIDQKGRIVDEVILSIMKSPKSYTREDVVEISCHGGVQSVEMILDTVLALGARMAEPGEFTKRAFLNGRIDLVSAQAVIDVINSKTEMSHNQAMYRLEGKLSSAIKSIREKLLNMLALIEVSIDYPEHDMEEENIMNIRKNIVPLQIEIEAMVQSGRTGQVISQGIQAVILGRPNVGKSSLLNGILKSDRAIVTDIPGTTRDILRETANIKGIPLKIADTAGIRQTSDIIEQAGVNKSYEYASSADLILLVLDGSVQITPEDLDIIKSIASKQIIIVLNKSDLTEYEGNEAILSSLPYKTVKISAKNSTGFDKLYDTIYDLFVDKRLSVENTALISNNRDLDYLRKAHAHISEALSSADNRMAEDIIAIDLSECYAYLGKIIGESVEDDVIDRVFSEFCLGK